MATAYDTKPPRKEEKGNLNLNKDEDFKTEARKRLQLAIDATTQCRVYQVDDVRFAAGSPDNKLQWPEKLVRAREADPNGARPVLTINKLPQHINQITGEQRHNRPSIKVMPVDDKADQDVAEVLNGVIRHIEYNSDADVSYAVMGENQVTHGEGYVRVLTDYCDPLSFEQDIRIEQLKNSFSVYMDPIGLARDATGRFCEWAFIVEDMSADEFAREYPDAEPVNWEIVGLGDEFRAWFPDKDVVRVAEYFCYKYREADIFMWADGKVTEGESEEHQARMAINALEVPVASRKTRLRNLVWTKMNGEAVLEEREWAGECLPIVRAVGSEWYLDGKMFVSGIVRNAKDAQRMFNYWKSVEAETLALAPKAPYITPAEAVEGYEEDWQDANTKNLAYLKYHAFDDEGKPIPRPSREHPPLPPVGIVNAALGAADDIKSATGQYDPSLGNNPQAKSGVALRQEQRKTDVGTFFYIDNQARAIRQLGRVLVDLIPKIYDTRRIARIVGEDGTAAKATLDSSTSQPVTEITNEAGEIEKIYNPSIGRYDVTVAVGPGYTTKRQEAAEFMAQVLQGNAELMAKMGDLYFEMLDVPGADKIAKRLRKMLPPGLAEDDDEAQGQMVQTPQGPVPADVAGQMLAQAMGQIEQMGQALEKADVAGKEAAHMKAQADIAKSEADGENARTRRVEALSKVNLQDAQTRAIYFGMMRDYVDRTPTEDSGLLSPLKNPEPKPNGGAAADGAIQ